MHHEPLQNQQRLSEEDLRRVLQRAIELDAIRGNEITIESWEASRQS